MKKRTKIQWMYYLRENFWLLNPNYFQKFRRRKWRFLKKRFRRAYFFSRKIYGLKLKRYNRRNPYRKKKRYYKTLLKEKHKFKLYYNFFSEKKFKRILRKSFKYKKQKLAFYNLLHRRLDSILISAKFVKNMEMAKLFIENDLIYVNGRVISEINYIVQTSDIISVDERIKKHVLKNLIKKTRQKRFKKRFRFSKMSSFFEINFKTLEILIYNNFDESFFKVPVKIAFDLVRRAYRR